MTEPEEEWVQFAKGTVLCPWCNAEVPVPVLGRMFNDDEGRLAMATKPDLTEVWAHAWTHEEDTDA